jgi:hypothetical protein
MRWFFSHKRKLLAYFFPSVNLNFNMQNIFWFVRSVKSRSKICSSNAFLDAWLSRSDKSKISTLQLTIFLLIKFYYPKNTKHKLNLCWPNEFIMSINQTSVKMLTTATHKHFNNAYQENTNVWLLDTKNSTLPTTQSFTSNISKTFKKHQQIKINKFQV